MLKKTLLGGVVVIALIIFGFISLMRSCLSKYDERSMITRPLLFDQNGKPIIFSLVKFDITTSYNQNGGFIQKTVNTTYSIQTNDAITGEKIKEVTVKDHSDIKSYPVEIIGSSGNKAWIFAGELMAFDPFTLEKTADIKILEKKNPSFTGRFTTERKYYEFDKKQDRIFITMTNGSKYELDTKTLLLTASEESGLSKDPSKTRIKEIADALKNIQKASESAFQRFRDISKAYSQKLITVKIYQDSLSHFSRERIQLDKSRDSLYALQRNAYEEISYINSMNTRNLFLENENNSFNSIRSNSDTFFNKWYGLYTETALENISEQFDYRALYDDAARNRLYCAGISIKDADKKYKDWIIGEEKQLLGKEVYIQGGFLMDKEVAMPIHLYNPAGFLIAHKENIGQGAPILISRVDTIGNKIWTMNTGLKSLAYWIVKNNRLVITGNDNKSLSTGENNVLNTVDLINGKSSTFDFFNNKMRVTNK